MAKISLDRQAKSLFLRHWSKKIGGNWLRSQPIPSIKGKKIFVGPRLVAPGALTFKTQPDGLYLRPDFEAHVCDVVAFEVCGSFPNFFDKRARYAPSTQSLLVEIGPSWCNHFGKSVEFGDKGKVYLPVRHLRGCFVFRAKEYRTILNHLCPMGHEFFLPLSALKSFNSPHMKKFLYRLDIDNHFYATDHIVKDPVPIDRVIASVG